jgi:CheY-like chemotaxis protein
MPDDRNTPCGGNCRCRQRAERQPELPLLLIVDDDPDFLGTLAEAVEQTGTCRVITATSAAEALRRLREHEPVAVLTDHYMPKRTGTGLLADLKERFPRVRRLLMSGRATKTVLASAINRAEVQHYLPKQMRPKLLIDAVTRQLVEPT